MGKTGKIILRIVALAAVLSLLCAFCFLAVESDHCCVGEHCRICQLLALCRSLLRDLRLVAGVMLLCLAAPVLVFAVSAPVLRQSVTPVLLKVKLSD